MGPTRLPGTTTRSAAPVALALVEGMVSPANSPRHRGRNTSAAREGRTMATNGYVPIVSAGRVPTSPQAWQRVNWARNSEPLSHQRHLDGLALIPPSGETPLIGEAAALVRLP